MKYVTSHNESFLHMTKWLLHSDIVRKTHWTVCCYTNSMRQKRIRRLCMILLKSKWFHSQIRTSSEREIYVLELWEASFSKVFFLPLNFRSSKFEASNICSRLQTLKSFEILWCAIKRDEQINNIFNLCTWRAAATSGGH